MSTTPAGLPPHHADHDLMRPLARLRTRCRLYLALDGLGELSVVMVAVVAAQLLLDRWLRLSLDQRLVLDLVIAALWLWVAYRALVRRLRIPLGIARLAGIVDQRYPELQDRLTTGVEFAAGNDAGSAARAPALVAAVVAEACAAARQVQFSAVLNHRRARRRALGLLAICTLVALAIGFQPATVRIWFSRNWLLQSVPWPRQTHIYPLGFDQARYRAHARGDELEIVANVTGRMPRTATLDWWTPGGQRGAVPLKRVGRNRLQGSLGQVTESVSFSITGGDEHTPDHHVEVVDRPRIIHITARVTPPDYTGLDPMVTSQQTTIEILRGGWLDLMVTTNKPVAEAWLVGGGDRVPCVVAGTDRVTVSLPSPDAGSYAFDIRDKHGLENVRPVPLSIIVLPDTPPTARLELLDVGQYITPQARLDLAVSFEDTYGLATAAVTVQSARLPETVFELSEFGPGASAFAQVYPLDVATLATTPGDVLQLAAEATDFDPLGPNVGRSKVARLEVLSREDFLSALVKRELTLRREFEQLVAAQRALRESVLRILAETDAGDPDVLSRLAAQGRRQEWHAGRCDAFQRDFGAILAEMRTSRVARAADELRIGTRIAAPLAELAGDLIPAAATEITQSRGPAQLERVHAGQDEIVARMDAVLENMLEREGYREAVELLENIIAEQEEIREDTLEALERRLDELLGGFERDDDRAPEP